LTIELSLQDYDLFGRRFGVLGKPELPQLAQTLLCARDLDPAFRPTKHRGSGAPRLRAARSRPMPRVSLIARDVGSRMK